MSLTGRPQRLFRRPRRPYRILDLVGFGIDEVRVEGHGVGKASISTVFSGIEVSAPIYLADMSFGSLAGVPNIVEAELADELGLISGTGEGGLHPEVARHRRIFVQWASARFGVDINTLMAGMGIVIKIGQGAKPGIGGHLPGTKVTSVISMVRRIPVGVDALSPAPHHDIYSIEDLKQRIDALKEATGKPVYVKIAATNYAPYIATGIARMGADGIIVDGHGAGTGATPLVVRDNVGIPIELAIASIDRMLRDEGIRDRVTLIASGRVSTSDDALKLMALGADGVALGTALLISMGCAMARTCHRGNCPAGITSKITEGSLIVDHDFAKAHSMRFLRAFMEEMRLMLDYLGIDDVRKIVGRRDLLRARCVGEVTAKVLGVKAIDCEERLRLTVEGDLWSPDYSIYATQLVRTGDVVIVSMGSTGPPEVEPPKRLIDWLRFDGAQVTKPAIDPYREDIDTTTVLARGRLILSAPIILRPPTQWGSDRIAMVKFAAHATSLLTDLRQMGDVGNKHLGAVMWDQYVDGLGALVVNYEDYGGFRGRGINTPVYVRVYAGDVNVGSLVGMLRENRQVINGVLIEQLGGEYVEPYIVNLDLELKRAGLRHSMDLIVHMPSVRSSGDIIKLVALGADAVEVSELMIRALHGKSGKDFLTSMIRFIMGLRRELAQLLGAAGIYSLQSVVGNRELLRTMDDRVRELLMVKIAGEEVLYR
ncbi:FMN-binding glutamate synthase family protein [Vulcanisaeta thermophila]|uniref:FMN-binding glutamate synthase family protein n=1 Tax=Vulcanisaeta thermophila TaxID=867917 RepID=UPI0009FF82B8|nr:FMN-binding glutamate synthase family protein [Vulcanisaeta thermophila]